MEDREVQKRLPVQNAAWPVVPGDSHLPPLLGKLRIHVKLRSLRLLGRGSWGWCGARRNGEQAEVGAGLLGGGQG